MESTNGAKKPVNIEARIHKAWQFIGAPLLWLVAWLISKHLALAWLVILGIYIIVIYAMGIKNIADPLNLIEEQIWRKSLFKVLGPLAWGGFLALLYWMIYLLIFHFEDLNGR
ncbi:MAG TPA: hypothetical protein VJ464_04685 [Blastocatellia bacterium]|nr:hypothetical protein [Blastocatellia bacterium]